MTKQLAPIEEFTKFGMREHRGLTVFNDVELELVRQAIIRDFVSTLEPVHSQFFDVNKWYDYLNEKHKKNTIEAGYLHRDLYDLSEWRAK